LREAISVLAIADHLIVVPEDGIRAMANAGVVATLLPNAAFYLNWDASHRRAR
jgi:imidazolonepropionase-like amidohydrolase